MLHEVYSYDDELEGFVPVLARACSEGGAIYAQLDPAYATGKEGAIRKSVKIFAPGFFAGAIPGSNKERILPRTYTTAAVAANATSVLVKKNHSGIFVAGGTLSIILPSGRVNIASSSAGWAAADTVTIAIAGVSVSYAVISADVGGTLAATNQNVANKVLAAIKANPYLRSKVDGLTVLGATNSVDIVFWSIDPALSLHSLSASDTAANGTVTASGSAFVPNTTIGTISVVNTANDTLTISAAAISVPAGMPIGVATSSPANLGMLSPTQPIDLLYRESQNYALYTEAYVYRERLPYWDAELQGLFPEIVLV
jgi:hypothetical protein